MKNPLKKLSPALLFLVAAACSDTSGPIVDGAQEPEMRTELSPLKLRTPATADLLSALAITDERVVTLPGNTIQIAADGDKVSLSTYQVSFWVDNDEGKTVQVHYAPEFGFDHPYVQFTVEKEALYRRPDGTYFDDDDGILITITIDPSDMEVHLEPSGLQFRGDTQARLKMWYGHADPDHNGDGVVDSTDKKLEENALKMWVQQDPTSPWYGLNHQQSLEEKSITGHLKHFSGYAVSW